MAKIYCIPGLGNDKRIFDNLAPLLVSQDIHFLEHIAPSHRKEPLRTYMYRLCERIHEHKEESVVIGMSLGGLMAVELSKILPMKHVFLVSTIQNSTEIPKHLRPFKHFPINRIMPFWAIQITSRPVVWALQVTDKKGRDHIQGQLDAYCPKTFKWGERAVLNWEDTESPESLTHIHGTHDEIFPIRQVNNTHTIQKGNHYMIMDRAEEVASIINRKLLELFPHLGK
ncbi:MAG: alpha/beta hydrolase [Saprospiraceae bacterium]|nr:alpha/beta hydrolase [Saprospiraceae bacterium]